MELSQFLLYQLLAHVLADYYLQTDTWAYQKNTLGFKSKFLARHTFIVFLLSWLLSFQVTFYLGAAVIAITHYFIDGFKAQLNSHQVWGKYAFFLDQLLHIVMLVTVSYLFYSYHGFHFYWEPPISTKLLAVIMAYVLCFKPANIFIKEVFRAFEIDVAMAETQDVDASFETKELPNAGKLIGILERLLALTFILIGQYQAVGFLIAAKSVLRYKDTDTLKTEYVLIGTMLSFGIAVLLGVLTTLF